MLSRFVHAAIAIRKRTAAQRMLALVMLSFAVLSTACSYWIKGVSPTLEWNVLTPISMATVDAYRPTFPIENRLQAVILARVGLGEGHLIFTGDTRVVSVEEMKFADAIKKLPNGGGGWPLDTNVWLVVFEGDWSGNFDPFHTVTPPPPAHGCAYVILDAADGRRTENEAGCSP